MVKDDQAFSVFRTMTYEEKLSLIFSCHSALITTEKQDDNESTECDTLGMGPETGWRPGNVGVVAPGQHYSK
jgi:hypothetical protein